MGIINTIKNVGKVIKIANSVLKEQSDATIIYDSSTSQTSLRNIITSTGKTFYTQSYEKCSAVQSIISKKANALIRCDIVPADEDDNILEKQPQGFKEAVKLINKPNEYQDRNQFLRSIETFMNIYGACYIYEVKPLGMNKTSALIVIPNMCITTQYKNQGNILSNNSDEIVDYYTINLFGYTYVLRNEDRDKIHVIKDSTMQLSVQYPFEPQSRLDSLRYNVENVIASQESRNVLIVKRGAEGVLSPDRTNDTAAVMNSLNDKERERLQKEYSRYGMLKDQWHTLITKVPMRYTSMTKSATDLGLLDGEISDVRTISDSYGVPTPLIGIEDNKKYNNYTEAKKDFYEGTIIPESKIIAESLSTIVNAKGWKFYFDYSGLEFMQKSNKEKADIMSTMVSALNDAVSSGLMTVEEAKEILEKYK